MTLKRLSLAIVDEQHRFGVGQRLGLRAKGAAADLLVMTATPIPRSLALTLYGDLDTSYLRERPATAGGSVSVTTTLVPRSGREGAYTRVRKEVAQGRQAYVVCALVEEGEVEAKAATKEAERLRSEVFPDLRVGLLTGRMRPAEKVATMREFRDRLIDVLVSTTVIEVGVDVPNATVMIVENAERFGLAQLHQLRGRIGRGVHAGEFLLFADARTNEGRERMQAIASTSDGFELAEYDLKLRGEGQLLGERQHGMPELRLASIVADAQLLDVARAEAVALVEADPHLSQAVNGPLRLVVDRDLRQGLGVGEQRVRIVAGEFKGRAIAAPRGRSTRPTSDRAREGLFSALSSRLGADLGGASVLDAYAGSGALGLEAISRGAREATFVEKDATAVRSLRSNVASLGVRGLVTVINADVSALCRRGTMPRSPFSLLFLDPPYRIGQSEVRALVEGLAGSGCLADDAVIVWEHDAADAVSWPESVEPLFDLGYGSTRIDAGTYTRGDAG